MKRLLIGLLALGCISAFAQAQDMNAIECTKKAENAAYTLAQLELGDDIIIVDGAQDVISTQMTLNLTVRQNIRTGSTRPKILTYEVKTIDQSESDLCAISSIKLK